MTVYHQLECHPLFQKSDEFKIEAELKLLEDGMNCEFRISGDLQQLVIPEILTLPKRQLGLWNSTCVEVYLLFEGGQYLEFNLSPSLNWEMFHHLYYRQGLNIYDHVCVQSSRQLLDSQLMLLSRIQCVLLGEPQAYALTAVLESRRGQNSYWAIRHMNSEKPDFHDPKTFIRFK